MTPTRAGSILPHFGSVMRGVLGLLVTLSVLTFMPARANGDTPFVFMAGGNGIYRQDIGSGNVTQINSTLTWAQIAFDEVNQKLYAGKDASLYRMDIDGGNLTTVETGLGGIAGLEVDAPNSRAFVMDSNPHSGAHDRVYMVGFGGGKTNIYNTGPNNPQDCEFYDGRLWNVASGNQQGGGLQVSNASLNGVINLIFLGSPWPSPDRSYFRSLDVIDSGIYTIRKEGYIERRDHAAGNPVNLLDIGSGYDIDIDAAAGQMYWTEYNSDVPSLHRAALDGSNHQVLNPSLPEHVNQIALGAPVPVPGAALLGMIGIAMIGAYTRKRRQADVTEE